MNNYAMNNKLQKVFQRIIEPDYNPSSNFCLDKLLNRLSETSPDGDVALVELPTVMNYIFDCFNNYNDCIRMANSKVKTFILRLVAKISEKEKTFDKLLQGGIYSKLFAKIDISKEKNPSIKLSLLEILNSMLSHESGVDWLLHNKKWLEVLHLCQQNQTIYFFRNGVNFIQRITWKLNDLNKRDHCHEILTSIVTPLVVNKWSTCTVLDDEADLEMYTAFYPSLTILTEILYKVERFGKTNHIIKFLAMKFNLKWQLCQLFHNCRKTNLLITMSKLIYVHWMAEVSIEQETYRLGNAELDEYSVIQCNSLSAMLSKRNPEVIIEISSFAFILLCKIRDHHKVSMTYDKEGKHLDFTNQIMIVSLVPMLCSLKLSKNEFVDVYVDKLVQTLGEHTVRLIYLFRDLIKEKNDPMVVIKAIQSTVTYMKYLDKSQAVLIFQSFYYCLQYFVPQNQENESSSYVVVNIDTRETLLLVCTMLEAIYVYIEHFGIQWQETVESLCVHNFCARVLKTSNIDPKLNILAFKLSELTIKKYLSPNLALLMNSANGSVIEDLSRTIYVKLHDLNWSVRDSAMELLFVVVGIAEHKFTAFQQQIVENELPELVVTIAFEDSETYVRASALKCIAIMVRIKMFWENHLKFLDLPAKIMKLLYEESEGLVRKEAVAIVTNLYVEKKFVASILDDIFITMFHSAARDLHWEVQLAALEFWREVIHGQMSHQGMIDGVFPSVTFSKENRKIVHLTEMEIKKRLKKILNELSLRGCLGALLTCMNDESEIQVMEKSLDVINELFNLLVRHDFYDVDSISGIPSLPKPVLDASVSELDTNIAEIRNIRNNADVRNEKTGGEVSITLNSPSSTCPENFMYKNVIDVIVDSDDVNLLANVYTNRLKVNEEESNKNYDFAKTNGVKDVTDMFVHPSDFVKTVKETDYKKIIEDKYSWRAGIATDIHSLIDDIMAVYTTTSKSEVNTLDCY